jgi:tRNA (adenine57-N1/adenine58-N1)-methyltransferase
MWSTAREIAPGDLVIIWLVSSCVFDKGNLTVIITKTRDVIQPLLIKPGKDFNSKYGNYRHADLVGIPYGSKVGSRNGKGFVHVLRPTPELWTMALPHRTQILYLADIAFITSYLNIKRGSRVVEAGASHPFLAMTRPYEERPCMFSVVSAILHIFPFLSNFSGTTKPE